MGPGRGKEGRLKSGEGILPSVLIRALTVSVSWLRSETAGESPGARSHCQPEKRPVWTQLGVLPAAKEAQGQRDMAWRLMPLLLLLVWTASMCRARARTDLLNVCMDAKHHKTKPGPEDKLHGQVRRVWLELGRGLVLMGKKKSGAWGKGQLVRCPHILGYCWERR